HGRTDWAAVSRCILEGLFPRDASRAIAHVVRNVLGTESAQQAHRDLDDDGYPTIEEDAFAEFAVVCAERERRAAAESQAAAESYRDHDDDREDEREPAGMGDADVAPDGT